MRIGEVSKTAGVSVDTIRFYERRTLLAQPLRSPGGFRIYSERDLRTLEFIRRVQSLGFTLREIRALIQLRDGPVQPCTPVRNRLQAKLAHVARKLSALRSLERELRFALRACNRQMRGRPAHCPLLGGSSAPRSRARS